MRISLIFDVDGVMFDSHSVHRIAWWELLREVGKDVPDAELDFILEGATRDEALRHFLGPLSPQQIAFYARKKDAKFRHLEDRVQIVKGLVEFLDLAEAAAIPKAIASSGSRGRVERMLNKHGMASRFATVVTGDEVRVGKTNPAIFLRAAEELNVKPCEVVVLEDAIPAVEAVKKAGMKYVGIGTGNRRLEMLKAGADLVFPDFAELRLSDLYNLFRPPNALRQNLPSFPS